MKDTAQSKDLVKQTPEQKAEHDRREKVAAEKNAKRRAAATEETPAHGAKLPAKPTKG